MAHLPQRPKELLTLNKANKITAQSSLDGLQVHGSAHFSSCHSNAFKA